MTPEAGAVTRERRRVVAFLRVRTGPGGDGVLELLVHPDFRALGVATLLVERLGLDLGASTAGVHCVR